MWYYPSCSIYIIFAVSSCTVSAEDTLKTLLQFGEVGVVELGFHKLAAAELELTEMSSTWSTIDSFLLTDVEWTVFLSIVVEGLNINVITEWQYTPLSECIEWCLYGSSFHEKDSELDSLGHGSLDGSVTIFTFLENNMY